MQSSHCLCPVPVLLQVIPRQLCDNAGFDATDMLNKLRQKHALADGSGKVSGCVGGSSVLLLPQAQVDSMPMGTHAASFVSRGSLQPHTAACPSAAAVSMPAAPQQYFGVDVNTGGVVNTFDAFVWEPALVKLNAIQVSTHTQPWVLRYAGNPTVYAHTVPASTLQITVTSCDSPHTHTELATLSSRTEQRAERAGLFPLCRCSQSATEAACLILSVDETVKNPRSEAPDAAAMGAGRGGGRGMRGGRGRGMRR